LRFKSWTREGEKLNFCSTSRRTMAYLSKKFCRILSRFYTPQPSRVKDMWSCFATSQLPLFQFVVRSNGKELRYYHQTYSVTSVLRLLPFLLPYRFGIVKDSSSSSLGVASVPMVPAAEQLDGTSTNNPYGLSRATSCEHWRGMYVRVTGVGAKSCGTAGLVALQETQSRHRRARNAHPRHLPQYRGLVAPSQDISIAVTQLRGTAGPRSAPGIPTAVPRGYVKGASPRVV
jgi:hypothetical protein